MTALAQEPGPMTAEQLFDLPDDGRRHELVAGELHSMAPADRVDLLRATVGYAQIAPDLVVEVVSPSDRPCRAAAVGA